MPQSMDERDARDGGLASASGRGGNMPDAMRDDGGGRSHQSEVIQSSASSTYSTELSTERNSLNEAGDTITASTSQASIHDKHQYQQEDYEYYDQNPYPSYPPPVHSQHGNPLIEADSEIDQAPSERRTSATATYPQGDEDDMNFFSFSKQKQPSPSSSQPAISPDSQTSVKRLSVSRQKRDSTSSLNKRISIVRNSLKGNRESVASIDFLPRNLDSNPHGETPIPSPYPDPKLSTFESFEETSDTKYTIPSFPTPPPRDTTFATPSPLTANHARFASESLTPSTNTLQPAIPSRPQSTMSFSFSPNKERQGSLALPPPQRNGSGDEFVAKSPNRFTNFFGWGPKNENQPEVTSPTYSPKSAHHSMKNVPPSIDVTKANSQLYGGLPTDSGVSLLPPGYNSATIEAMEEEIRAVSADLAASIRREMDLEDLVERLETEAQLAQNGDDRRTSDYFSDMGTPVRSLDGDGKEINLERIQRKAEQERAQIRLEMMEKVEDERRRRKAIETHVRELEQQVQRGGNLSPGMPQRIQELESQLEEARRKLSEERKVKENFEDLLVALRQDIEDHRNERDELRDQVVPRLRAQVQNLEAEKEKLAKMNSDHEKMVRELQNLRNENAALASAQRQIYDMKHVVDRQNKRASIAIVTNMSPTFSRAPSMHASGSMTPDGPRPKDGLAEKLKDVEAQRDALHKALKSLRERQELESKRAKERIKLLELERDKALAEAPGRHNREVRNLRQELDKLRMRAEDAVDKGFVVERSLGSLKKDMERAEEERGTLRALLRGHEVLLVEGEKLMESHARLAEMINRLKVEEGAEDNWRDFSGRRELVLTKVAELEKKKQMLIEKVEETELHLANTDDDVQIERLKMAIAKAEEEKEAAILEAQAYKERADYLAQSEQELLASEQSLADQLRISAERIESLASQVRIQMDANNSLRIRLSDAIARGEAEQRMSAARINDFQLKLKKLEERLIQAQHQNEELVEKHEEEIQDLKQSHTTQLRRLQSSIAMGKALSPAFPLTPRSPGGRFERFPASPRGTKKLEPRAAAKNLEDRIVELERALADADAEMEEVVGRMTEAQMMVVELQGERDEAVRAYRKLVREVVGEESKWVGF